MNNYYFSKEDSYIPVSGHGAYYRQVYLMGVQSNKRLSSPASPSSGQRQQRDVTLRVIRNILTDAHGNYYEQVNSSLRLLGEIVRDRFGRIYEVNRKTVYGSHGPREPDYPDLHTEHQAENRPVQNDEHANSPQPRNRPGYYTRIKPIGLVYEKLFPEPGMCARIPPMWFVRELGSQIAYPDLLDNRTLIDCMIQVFRIYRPVSMERLLSAEDCDPAKRDSFHLLTPEGARVLGIHSNSGFDSASDGRSDNSLYPGDYVCKIEVLFDPTVQEAEMQRNGDTLRETDSKETLHST